MLDKRRDACMQTGKICAMTSTETSAIQTAARGRQGEKPATGGQHSATGHSPDDARIDAGWVLTVDSDNTVLREHAVIVSNGRISDCLPWADAGQRYPNLPVVDRRQAILMPGLINAHTHLAMNLMRGFADDLPLMSWLQDYIWPVEARILSHDYVRDGTDLALAESLLGGVTTVNDMYFFSDAVADACQSAGIRATVGLIILDFPTAWAQTSDEYFERGLALHDRLRGNTRIRPALAPHAPYTVSRKPLERIAMLSAELDLPVHMHVHETADEVRDFVARHGVRPIARLHEIGLLNPALLAVHLTQLEAAEITLLADNGVHALHCPESNMKLASGFCPVAELEKAGVNIAVGTDSASSNNDLDLLGEMRTAALLAKAVSGDAACIPAADAIRMITINAARALGIDNEVGSLEIGKAADMITIEPDITMLPMYDVASHIAYSTSRDRVRDAWVAGQALMLDRQLLTLDVEKLSVRAHEWSAQISGLISDIHA